MLQEVHNDICARLPYGVIVHTELGDGHLCEINQTLFGNKYRVNVEPTKRETFTEVIPYLRPMESMTEEEKNDLRNEHIKDEQLFTQCIVKSKRGDDSMRGKVIPHFAADWCNKKMFDYRGHILMGLALPAKEGMYN